MTDLENAPTPAIRVDGERSTATLTIPDACDAALLEISAIERLARDEGVRVDAEVTRRMQAAVSRFLSEARETTELIAEMREPEHGRDGWIEWSEGLDPGDGCTPLGADDGGGKVDFYNCQSYLQVREGAHVATLHEPTPGEDGIDLAGALLRATPGRACEVRVDQSLEMGSDGRIVACIDGLLQFKKNKIRITPEFCVDGWVDFSTGNIEFDGTVAVAYGVCDRFRVSATANIIVEGLVQAAALVCGGDLICRQGMAARDRGTIEVGGDAIVGYLEGAHGTVSGDLAVERAMVHCELEVGGDVRGAEAAMIGGRISVGGALELARIGSNAGTVTVVSFAEPSADFKLRVGQRICAGTQLLIGGWSVVFRRDTGGPLTITHDLREDGEREPTLRVDGVGACPLATVAEILRSAA